MSTKQVKRNMDDIRKRRLDPLLGKVIHFLLLGGPLLNIHRILESLPLVIQVFLIVLLGTLILRILLRFPRWNDEMLYLKQFVGAVAFLIGVVLLENFCTWYVASPFFGRIQSIATSCTSIRESVFVRPTQVF